MTNIYVDANSLIFLTKAGSFSGTGSSYLNNLIQPDGDLILTTTVRQEVRDNLNFDQRQIFQTWVNQNISSGPGGIQEVRTFRSGPSKGELSVVDAYQMLSDTSSDNLIISSDIDRFDWGVRIPGIDNVGLNPDATQLRDTVKSLDALLFNGAITPREYMDTIEGLQRIPDDEFSGELYNDDGSPRFIDVRQPYIGPDGSTITLVGGEGWVHITRIGEDGKLESYWVSPDQKFVANGRDFILPEEDPSCFGPEVPIDMWPLDPDLKPGADGIYDQDAVRSKIWTKPIELIRVGDLVVSFDDDGNLVPGPVTRTFQNDAKILLNFHGTRVTPGHVYYRPDSKKPYKYETLIDVLRDDGVIQRQDGTLIRAATNVPVGSSRDSFVRAIAGKRKTDGTFEQTDKGRIRLGTRFLLGDGNERKSFAVADLIEQNGGVVGEDELVRVGDSSGAPLLWDFGDMLPKPEDFVLECSGTTLEDIYKAAEWESQAPRLPAPVVLDRGPVEPLNGADLMAMPRNEPLDVSFDGMSAPKPQRMLNRKQRKAMEAKQRKANGKAGHGRR